MTALLVAALTVGGLALFNLGLTSAAGGHAPGTGDPSLSVFQGPTVTYLWFNETGLPSGTFWYVWANSVFNDSNGSSIGFTVYHPGTWCYAFGNVFGYNTPDSGCVNVGTTNMTVPVVWVLTSYSVQFTETGLPLGTEWFLNVTGQVSVNSTSTAASISLANGNYSYNISSVNAQYSPSPANGTFSVAGNELQESVTFSLVATTVTFEESGLPPGLPWQVTVNGGTEELTTDGGTDSLAFSEAIGTYDYTVTDNSGWHQTTLAYNGQLVVSGGAVTEPTLVYTPVTYVVTISESGLPSELPWQVTVNGANEYLTTDGSTDSLTFADLANGTYSYTIAENPGWYQTTLPYSGSILVTGGTSPIDGSGIGYAVTLVYTLLTYSVAFSERGLPSGLTWQVTVNGGAEYLTTNSATDSLSWTGLRDGTYDYTITDNSGWHQTTLPYKGQLVVSGGAVTEPTLVYTSVTYALTFAESGLPSDLKWQVTVNAVAEHLTTDGATDTLTFTEPNGTPAYTIADNPGWHQTTLPYNGEVGVDAGTVTESTLVYVPETYSVTFAESGLPSGTAWTVVLGGIQEWSSTSPWINLTHANASLAFSFLVVPGHRPSPSQGLLRIAGQAATEEISFTNATYSAVFVSTGLPAGSSWAVNFSGTLRSSKQSSISFTDPNGTYSFQVNGGAGLAPSPKSGHLTLQGSNTTVSVSWGIPTYTVTFEATGLPAGTTWGVLLDGYLQTNGSGPIVFDEPNGTYNFSLAPLAGYTGTPSNGPVHVRGKPVTEFIAWASPSSGIFPIVFTQVGLPNPANWALTFDGITYSPTNGSILLNVSNGTYPFSVTALESYVGNPSSGWLAVSGRGLSIMISFNKPPTVFQSLAKDLPYALGGLAVLLILVVLVVRRQRRRARTRPPTTVPSGVSDAEASRR